MLTCATELNESLAARCPSVCQTIKQLALYAGIKFLDLSAGKPADNQLKALHQLISTLQQHSDQATWAAALLQASLNQLPGLLPCILSTGSQVGS